MNTKKFLAALLAIVMICAVLTACGGEGDALKGTWSGTYQDGEASWEFDGNGNCKLTNVFLQEQPGTYTIKSDTEVEINMDGWDAPITYTYKIEGDKLTLTADNPLSPNYELQKN